MNKLKKCKTCGEDVARSAKICPHCGASHFDYRCGIFYPNCNFWLYWKRKR